MAKKQPLKNKIRTEIIKIVSVPPKRKGDTGYLKLTDEEIDKIVELFKNSIQRFIEETTKELREELAELEHKQLESWTRCILEEWVRCEGFADGFLSRLERKWTENWKPYSELPEEDKDKSRVWANKVLGKLKQNQAKWLEENL